MGYDFLVTIRDISLRFISANGDANLSHLLNIAIKTLFMLIKRAYSLITE